ncbi:MAG: TROVE domain-containing protein [Prevotella sp.]|nr:TROVE domain-containing protein [Prevotella sp.]
MSKFNTIIKEQSVTLNHEGAEAYRLSAEMELYTAVVTTSLSDKYYETADERIERIANLVGKCDARFVAQLAVYARTEMNLRSVPLLLVVELAKHHSGDNLVSKTVEKVVLRADEIMELLHCYQWRNSHNVSEAYGSAPTKKLAKLSHQIQVGLQRAFNKFDEYQFAKYDRSNLEVKLRDALFIVHPKAKDNAQQELFNKITNKTLETPYTWETELSALGQQKYRTSEERQRAFAEKWEELIASGKLGYMAMLRNLRNFLENDVARESLVDVANRLSDEREVIRSKQFPFRFLSAYRELLGVSSGNTQLLMDALERAILASGKNITGFNEHTRVLLACDVSGSMYSPINPKSSVKNYDIGLVLAMLLKSRCENVISGIFGNDWKVVNLPSTSILSNVEQLYKREGEVGYATNGYKVIRYLNEENIAMDKVMMFTDCQMWDNSGNDQTIRKEWDKYKQIAPNAKLYLFDLSGYGTTPLDIVRDDVVLIGGWSDRIFDILGAIENGSNALAEIRKIEI